MAKIRNFDSLGAYIKAVFKGGLRDQPPEMLTFFLKISIVFVYLVK